MSQHPIARRPLLAALLLPALPGCGRLGPEAPAARPVADAEPLSVPPFFPAGDLRAPTFDYQLAVYHREPPAPQTATRAKAMLAEAGVAILTEKPTDLPTAAGAWFETVSPKGTQATLLDFDRFGEPAPTPSERAGLLASPAVTLVHFSGPREAALSTYRRALEALAAIEEDSPGLLWDQGSCEAFTRAAWRRRLGEWRGGFPDLARHLVIESGWTGELSHATTRGMAKLALPDITVNRLTAVDLQPMQDVMRLLAQTMLERPTLPEDGRLVVDDGTIKGAARSPEDGSHVARAQLDLAIGERHPYDVKNRLIEIVFPGPAASVHQRQATIAGAYPASRELRLERLEEAANVTATPRLARTGLLRLKPAFSAVRPHRAALFVKVELSARRRARGWLEVVRWQGARIEGVLVQSAGDPLLPAGTLATVLETEILDYVGMRPDGSSANSTTFQGQEDQWPGESATSVDVNGAAAKPSASSK